MSEYRIQQATARREEAEAALLRPDGSRYYSDEEHAERVRAIRARHRAEFDAIDAEIEERAGRAQADLETLENADPAAGLSTEELQRAAAMNQFVGAEVEGLSLANLARRCRAAASSGDKAMLYALQHHAARRMDEDLTGEVREAVAELRRAIEPEAESRLAAAREALEDAGDLRLKAQLARAGAANLGDAFFGGGNYWGAAS